MLKTHTHFEICKSVWRCNLPLRVQLLFFVLKARAVLGKKPYSSGTACERLCPDTAWLSRGISFRPFLGDACLKNCPVQMICVLPYWMTVQTNCWAWAYLTRAINTHDVQFSSAVKSEGTWRDKFWFNPALGRLNLELNFTNFASSSVLLFF